MDSRQLRYFIAVYEQRNLSRAADQANVAQSALSHHIANLEAEFATPLFERKPRGMEPTAAGERLYEHARIILRAMAAAEREIREGGSEIAGDISIGMANSGMKAIGVPLMRTVLTKYPNLKLSLTESLSGATLLHLLSSDVDLALVYNPPSEKDLVAEPVLEEQMFCVGTEKLIGRKAPISFEEVARLPLILLRHGIIDQGAREVIEPKLTRTLYLCRLRNRPMTYVMEEMCRLIRALIADQVGRGAWEATLLI
jgi:LysR family nitrogen assimilation transcriptional regulator